MTLRDAIDGFVSGLRKQTAAVSAAPNSVAPNPTTRMVTENPTQANIPQAWVAALMGPGWPITPFGVGAQRNIGAETEPRSFQYIPQVNATLSPRIGYGLTAFSQLKYWAEQIPEVAMCRRLLVEEMKNFVPQILGPDGNVVQKARVVLERDKQGRPLRDEFGQLKKIFTGENEIETDDRLRNLRWLTTDPWPRTRKLGATGRRDYGKINLDLPARTDGGRGELILDSDGHVSIDKRAVDVTVTDVAWELARPDRKNAWPLWLSRFLYNVIAYDAVGLYRIRDADTQTIGLRVVDGSTLFLIVDERGEQPEPPAPAFTQIIFGQPRQWFNTYQLWYSPRVLRADSPYGIAPSEDAQVPINFLDQLWQHETAFYTEGTVPEMVFLAPKDWEPGKVIETERLFNARFAGNPKERRRIKFLPNGFERVETKPHDWPKDSYGAAHDLVALTYGIHPSELGKLQGTGLSGSKGGSEKGEDSHARMGIGPLKEYTEAPFNDILLEADLRGYTFELGAMSTDINPKDNEQMWAVRWSSGMVRRNDALLGVGMDAVSGPAGDAYLMPQGKADMVYDDSGQMRPTTQTAEQAQAQSDAAVQGVQALAAAGTNGAGAAAADDKQQAQQESGKDKAAKPAGAVPAAGGGESDAATQPAKMYVAGFPAFAGNDSEYWRAKISAFEKAAHVAPVLKHCGVCVDDDSYFGAPVARSQTVLFPEQGANETEIVSIGWDWQERRPALWKPQGGENDLLVQSIGGPLYVREEAAYLLDRALRFYLVPLAYVAELDDERGAIIHYVRGNEPRMLASDYDPSWVEKGAVLDFIAGQTDRSNHNWLTHPDDAMRPLLFDNGLSFPTTEKVIGSAFVTEFATSGQPLSPATLASLQALQLDIVWRDILQLVGDAACAKAQQRCAMLCDNQCVPLLATPATSGA